MRTRLMGLFVALFTIIGTNSNASAQEHWTDFLGVIGETGNAASSFLGPLNLEVTGVDGTFMAKPGTVGFNARPGHGTEWLNVWSHQGSSTVWGGTTIGGQRVKLGRKFTHAGPQNYSQVEALQVIDGSGYGDLLNAGLRPKSFIGKDGGYYYVQSGRPKLMDPARWMELKFPEWQSRYPGIQPADLTVQAMLNAQAAASAPPPAHVHGHSAAPAPAGAPAHVVVPVDPTGYSDLLAAGINVKSFIGRDGVCYTARNGQLTAESPDRWLRFKFPEWQSRHPGIQPADVTVDALLQAAAPAPAPQVTTHSAPPTSSVPAPAAAAPAATPRATPSTSFATSSSTATQAPVVGNVETLPSGIQIRWVKRGDVVVPERVK